MRNQIITLSFLISLLASSFMNGAESKPNVLLIVCDDLNDYIAGMGGHPQAKTPNLERFAQTGVLFKRAYSNNPVCAPSRSSFLTGIYPHTSLNFFWGKWQTNPVLKNSKTLMRYFKDNGYHVAGTGKLMHHHVRGEWSEYKHKTDYGPYWYNGKDRSAHPSVPEPMHGVGPIDGSFASLGNVPADRPEGSGWVTGWGPAKLLDFSNEEDRDLTIDEINAKWTSQKIKEYAKGDLDKPFFLAVGFVRPHTPLHVPQKYFDMFPEDEVLLPELKSGDKEDTYYHASLKKEDKGTQYFRYLEEGFGGDLEGLKKFTRAYLASVASVDDNIGQVLETLEGTHLKDNTIVVMTSDHGWNMGEKGHMFKNSPWEESCRVPLIIRAPGVSQSGGVAEHPVSLIDIYPTLKDLCGLDTDTKKNPNGANLDGHSVRPFLVNPASEVWEGPDAALTMIYAGPENNGNSQMQHWSIRTKDHRYIKYNNGKEELYDHQKDPNEWTNLASNPEYGTIKEKMHHELMSMIPSAEESKKGVEKLKKASKGDADKWKDTYFKKNPSADTNGDGQLSWPEFQAHKKANKK